MNILKKFAKSMKKEKNMRFNKGDYFEYKDTKYVIKDVLGVGGQGEVYLVNDGTNNYAFKYYIDPS